MASSATKFVFRPVAKALHPGWYLHGAIPCGPHRLWMEAKAKNDLRLATGLWAEWVPFPLQISNKLIPSRFASFGSPDLTVRNLFIEHTTKKEPSSPRGSNVSWSASWHHPKHSSSIDGRHPWLAQGCWGFNSPICYVQLCFRL